MTMKEIGENFKQIREENNKSVYDVEREIGISHVSQYKWEQGKQEPSIMSCVKLAEYYGITLDNLVFFK